MPFDQDAAVAVAADAARSFAEGLRGIVLKAAAEVDGKGQKLVEDEKRLEASKKALEAERKRLEADVQGLENERKKLAADRSALDGQRKGLEKDKAAVDEMRKSFNNDRTGLNRDRAVLAQERGMFEKQQAELSKAREAFCKERVDFEEQTAKKQAAAAAAAAAAATVAAPPPARVAEESTEMVALNLGGEANVTVFLSTLLQCPESRFTSAFSRPRELPRDAEGRIFVDFKPALFVPLLEHLRMRRIEEPSDPTPPPEFDSAELEGQFNKMLQHYGLKDWVYRTDAQSGAGAAAKRPLVSAVEQVRPLAAAAGTQPSPVVQVGRQPSPVVGAELQDAAQKVVLAEAKVRETLLAAAPLQAEGAESSEVEVLKAASAKTLEAEKSAAIACAEAKKVLVAKQKDQQAAASAPGYQADLGKLQARLTAAQQELSKQRKVAVQGERLWKGKLAFAEQESVVKQLEAQVARAAAGSPALNAAIAQARAALQAAQPAGEAPGQGYLATLSARVDRCQEKIASFRPKASPQQEVSERLARAEQAVKQTVLAAQPLTAGGEELDPVKAQEICETVGKAEREAAQKVEEARAFIAEKQRQSGGAALSHFAARINGMKGELAQAKAAVSGYEMKMVVKVVTQQVGEAVQELDKLLENVKEAVEPVLDQSNMYFIVAGMVRMIAEALDEHRQTSGVTRESLFMKMGPGAFKGKVTEREFVQFLGRLPSMCSQQNVSFSEEQRSAIFKHLDKDSDGSISKADFMGIFCDRYVCLKETIITKQLELVSGTIGKLQVNDTVELTGDMESDLTTGIVRAQVSVLKNGMKGWVTVRSNAGDAYLIAMSPFQDFVRIVEQQLAQVPAASQKANQFIAAKIGDLADQKQGPLHQLKLDLQKERLKIPQAQASYAKLKKRLEDFKQQYNRTPLAGVERRKSLDSLERKASTLSNAAEAEST